MKQINEVRAGSGVEFEAKVLEIISCRRLWKCFNCQNKGLFQNCEDISVTCPNCGAMVNNMPGKGLWIQKVETSSVGDGTGIIKLDLWGQDVGKIRKHEILHFINCYVKEVNNELYVSKGKTGRIVKVQDV